MSWWQGEWTNPWDIAAGAVGRYIDPFDWFTDVVEARTNVPTVVIQPVGTPEFIPSPAPSVPSPVVIQGEYTVIDPEEGVQETVFEEQNEWYRDTAPTDWGRVYDEYVILNPTPVELEEEPEVTIWSTLLGNVASQYIDTRFAPQALAAPAQIPNVGGFGNTVNVTQPRAVQTMQSGSCSTCPTGSPRYSKICNATGEITPLRRRRRRRLLTAGDLSDIAALKAIIGGGAGLGAAVVKAMR